MSDLGTKKKKYLRDYYLKNRVALLAKSRKYYQENRERARSYYHNGGGKELRKEYYKTERGKATILKYRNSTKGRTYRYKYNHSEKGKTLKYKYAKTERWRSIHRGHSAEYRRENPEKTSAQRKLRRAIENGEINRGLCVTCGSGMAHGHHEDYTKPLDVIWLCAKHHKDRHKEINNLG